AFLPGTEMVQARTIPTFADEARGDPGAPQARRSSRSANRARDRFRRQRRVRVDVAEPADGVVVVADEPEAGQVGAAHAVGAEREAARVRAHAAPEDAERGAEAGGEDDVVELLLGAVVE